MHCQIDSVRLSRNLAVFYIFFLYVMLIPLLHIIYIDIYIRNVGTLYILGHFGRRIICRAIFRYSVKKFSTGISALINIITNNKLIFVSAQNYDIFA